MPLSSINTPIVATSVPRSLSKPRWTRALSSHPSSSPTLDHRFHPLRMSRHICHTRPSSHTSAWCKSKAKVAPGQLPCRLRTWILCIFFGSDTVANLSISYSTVSGSTTITHKTSLDSSLFFLQHGDGVACDHLPARPHLTYLTNFALLLALLDLVAEPWQRSFDSNRLVPKMLFCPLGACVTTLMIRRWHETSFHLCSLPACALTGEWAEIPGLLVHTCSSLSSLPHIQMCVMTGMEFSFVFDFPPALMGLMASRRYERCFPQRRHTHKKLFQK